MAIIQESFIRCGECGNPEFKESKRYMFHKTVRERDDKTKPLPPIEEKIVYVCTQCGHELNR